MAVQPNNRKPEQNPTAGKIVKTPAPDAVDNIRSPTGVGQGQDGPQNRSWCLPGHASESPLASNLRQSQADSEDVLSKVIAGGVAGRDDKIPADGNTQTRTVSDTPFPTTFGMKGAAPGPKIPGAK
jgi:hypothetical protein